MKQVSMTGLVTLLTLCVSSLSATEANWPQWRGPHRTDISSETGLLKSWPEGGPKRLWLLDNCGVGYSGPAVVGKKLYIMGAREDREQLFAIDVDTHKELWKADIGEIFSVRRGTGPRGTPTVVGDRVCGVSGKGNVVCADATNGKVLWKVSFTEDLGGEIPEWGYTESVLIDGDHVICTPGGEKGAVAALDAKTGKLVWQSKEFTDPAQYASTILAMPNQTRQYIQLTMNSLVGIAAADGKLLWKSEWPPGRTAVIPTPIYQDNHVFITSGYGAGCKLVKIGPDHNVSDVYFNKNMKNHHGGVILLDGHLYGYSDKIGWICQDFKTGEIVWREEEKLGKGAIAYADGRFYCLEEKEGIVVLIEASAAGWKEHGRFKLEPKSKLRQDAWRIWTHPVITGGRLYLRNQELLWCFDVKER